jgi:hypothetical protein
MKEREQQMRKTLLATAIATVALMAGASAAQAIVVRDADSGTVCSATQLSGNTVTGGCLIEDMSGTWQVAAYYGGQYHITNNCTGSFDIRIDGFGNFYATDQALHCTGWSQHQACKDSVTGETIPWASGGQGANKQMPICYQWGTMSGSNYLAGWAYAFGPNGELRSMSQTVNINGVANASFANTGADDEVYITAN